MTAALAAFALGALLMPVPDAPSGPRNVPLLTTHYDPSLAGINCSADCTTFGSGMVIQPEHYNTTAACLVEWRGATVEIQNFGSFVCQDSGGAVNIRHHEKYGIVIYVDILSREPLQLGPHRHWRLIREEH